MVPGPIFRSMILSAWYLFDPMVISSAAAGIHDAAHNEDKISVFAKFMMKCRIES